LEKSPWVISRFGDLMPRLPDVGVNYERTTDHQNLIAAQLAVRGRMCCPDANSRQSGHVARGLRSHSEEG